VVAIARACSAFRWAIAMQVPVAPEATRRLIVEATAGQVSNVDRKRRSPGVV
jgi:hypothetical protein